MPEQSAMIDVLTATGSALNVAGLTSLLGASGVRNDVPENPVYPYVRIECEDERRWDTFGKSGKALLIWTHVFSTAKSDLEAGTIVSKVIELLHYVAHSVANHALATYQFEEHFPAGDELIGSVRVIHRVVQFRVLVQQTT